MASFEAVSPWGPQFQKQRKEDGSLSLLEEDKLHFSCVHAHTNVCKAMHSTKGLSFIVSLSDIHPCLPGVYIAHHCLDTSLYLCNSITPSSVTSQQICLPGHCWKDFVLALSL